MPRRFSSPYIFVLIFFSACFIEPEVPCSNIDNIPCPAGFTCERFECFAVCQSGNDCAADEACVEQKCKPYSQSCDTDEVCIEGFFCQSGACARKVNRGESCNRQNQCSTGFCVDGVCCDSACDASCVSCVAQSNGFEDGTCATIDAGLDPDQECDANARCDGQGSCATGLRGTPCDQAVDCQDNFCVEGLCCNSACDESSCESCQGALTGEGDGFCHPILAGQIPEKESNGGIDACPDDFSCNGEGRCYSARAGERCDDDDECEGGSCAPEGRCCEVACDGPCEACTPEGLCEQFSDSDPDNECPGTFMCNGNSACFTALQGESCTHDTQCQNSFCIDGICCDQAECAGSCQSCDADVTGVNGGICAPVLAGENPQNTCGDLGCNGTGACEDGEPQGEACAPDRACADGLHCVDGICCDEDCDEQCRSCSGGLTGFSDGVCTYINAGEDDPKDSCTSHYGCNGTGGCASAKTWTEGVRILENTNHVALAHKSGTDSYIAYARHIDGGISGSERLSVASLNPSGVLSDLANIATETTNIRIINFQGNRQQDAVICWRHTPTGMPPEYSVSVRSNDNWALLEHFVGAWANLSGQIDCSMDSTGKATVVWSEENTAGKKRAYFRVFDSGAWNSTATLYALGDNAAVAASGTTTLLVSKSEQTGALHGYIQGIGGSSLISNSNYSWLDIEISESGTGTAVLASLGGKLFFSQTTNLSNWPEPSKLSNYSGMEPELAFDLSVAQNSACVLSTHWEANGNASSRMTVLEYEQPKQERELSSLGYFYSSCATDKLRNSDVFFYSGTQANGGFLTPYKADHLSLHRDASVDEINLGSLGYNHHSRYGDGAIITHSNSEKSMIVTRSHPSNYNTIYDGIYYYRLQ